MIEGLEQHFEALAVAMTRSLSDWTFARLSAIYYTGSSRLDGVYVREDRTVHSLPVDFELVAAVNQLRDAFRAANRPLWAGLVFDLQNDGKVRIQWDYDNVSECGERDFDEAFDRQLTERWQYMIDHDDTSDLSLD